MALFRDQVMKALGSVQDPELHKDIVSLNMVKDVRLDGSQVFLNIELTTPACPMKDVIRRDVESALRNIGADSVHIDFSANTRGPAGPPRDVLPQVRNILAVGAGKGGVGKSTVSLNLAVGLAQSGARVGLMDGDVYGPSMPTMLGIKGLPPQLRGNRVIPFFVHGIHAVTLGALVPPDKPLIWRGPMAHGAFKQLLLDNTTWPELDYLIVDLPPGTGDIPLALCQLLPLTGAVIVATPQQVALDDATRAINMFKQLHVPILGLVENMSYFVGPDGSQHDIFGRGGTEQTAAQMGLPYLGALPMFTELRINSDGGNPLANFTGNPKLAEALQSIVGKVAGQISKQNLEPAAPVLNIT